MIAEIFAIEEALHASADPATWVPHPVNGGAPRGDGILSPAERPRGAVLISYQKPIPLAPTAWFPINVFVG